MRTVFTERNTGFDDKAVIKQMNNELSNALHELHVQHSNDDKFDHIYKNTQQEHAMFEILIKYKKEYYSHCNTLYSADVGPPDLVSSDRCVQVMKQSLSKKWGLLIDKYRDTVSQSQDYIDECNRIYNILSAKFPATDQQIN